MFNCQRFAGDHPIRCIWRWVLRSWPKRDASDTRLVCEPLRSYSFETVSLALNALRSYMPPALHCCLSRLVYAELPDIQTVTSSS